MKNWKIILMTVIGISFILLNDGLPAQGWTPPVFLPKSGNGDIEGASIASDELGNLHVVWDEVTINSPDTTLDIYYSNWEGSLWSNPLNISNTPTWSVMPQITVDDSNHLHVFWSERLDSAPPGRFTDIFYSFSEGDTWSIPLRITETPVGQFINSDFNIAVDGENKVHVTWGQAGRLWFKYRKGSKGTWNPIEDGVKGFESDIAVDPLDTVHFAYVSSDTQGSGNNDVFYTSRSAAGGSWSNPVLVFADSGYSFFPKITVDGSGTIQILWLEDFNLDAFPDDIFHSFSNDGLVWTPAVNVTNLGGTNYPPTIVVDNSNNLHMAWDYSRLPQSLARDEILYMWWNGVSWSDTSNVSDNSGESWRPQMELDTNNCLHLVWIDYSTDEARVLYSNNCLTTGVKEENHSSWKIKLDQINPNPFSSTIQFTFTLSQESEISIKIYDIMGSQVKTLLEGNVSYGNHTLTWDGLDNSSQKIPSGIYFYRLTSGNFTDTRKLILLR